MLVINCVDSTEIRGSLISLAKKETAVRKFKFLETGLTEALKFEKCMGNLLGSLWSLL